MPVFGSPTQYATTTDLGNLGLIGGVLAGVSSGIQNAALLAASGIADASLQSRYILPLTQWGQDLVRAVCIIAAYDILTSKGYNPAAGADENIRQRYLDALAWLKSVSDGDDSPSYVLDSSVNQAGAVTSISTVDDSVVTTTEGGLQMTTTNVRGWTPRGSTTTIPPSGTGFNWP
jgi:phage gp36-like protein